MKCPICNKEIGTIDEIIKHLEYSHFLNYKDFIENEIIFNKIKCKRLSLKAKFDIIKMERRKKRLKRKYEKNKKPKESTSWY